jgi:hypothetical protein
LVSILNKYSESFGEMDTIQSQIRIGRPQKPIPIGGNDADPTGSVSTTLTDFYLPVPGIASQLVRVKKIMVNIIQELFLVYQHYLWLKCIRIYNMQDTGYDSTLR